MNSKRSINKIGVKKSHRDAMSKNLVNDLIIYEYITTTKAKAVTAKSMFDKVISIVKNGKDARNKELQLESVLSNNIAVKKLLEVYGKRFEKANSGFVNRYIIGPRKGDGAVMVKLIVKGYVHKEIGKKVSTSSSKQKVQAEPSKVSNDLSNTNVTKSSSQVVGNLSGGKVKTRAGI